MLTSGSIRSRATVAAGGMKMYGENSKPRPSKMYEYQASLTQQQSRLNKEYAAEQKKNLEKTSFENISAVQNQAAEQSKQLAQDVSRLTGTQRATMGALGIGGVTAVDISLDTFDKAKMDELAIRYNANVKSYQIGHQAKGEVWTLGEETKFKSFALESEAVQYGAAAKNARRAGNIAMTGTLLQTAAQVAAIGSMSAGGGGTAVAGKGWRWGNTPASQRYGTYTK